MTVTARNNGSFHASGAGYGLRVDLNDRDLHFKREWDFIILEINGEPLVRFNIKKASFWGDTCHELIKKEIGLWFLKIKKAPWPKGNPPKFLLEPTKDNHFSVKEM